MTGLRRVCVYCGSSPGGRPQYAAAAAELGQAIAARGLALVYGGASVGLMGVLADAALAAGGRVVGVIPQLLSTRELAHAGLTEQHVVTSMHERKSKMAELSDLFVALPGGIGTLDELFEMWTWSQLGLHAKPCALLNIDGYYDALIAFLDHARSEGFVRLTNRAALLAYPDVESFAGSLDRARDCVTTAGSLSG